MQIYEKLSIVCGGEYWQVQFWIGHVLGGLSVMQNLPNLVDCVFVFKLYWKIQFRTSDGCYICV